MPNQEQSGAHGTRAPQKRYMRRTEASRYLQDRWGISRKPNTMAKEHCLGIGPTVAAYDGRIPLYDEPGLDAYAAEKIRPVAA